MRSMKSRKFPLLILSGAALAGLVALAALRGAPFLESSYSALGEAASAAGRLVGPPLRRLVAGSGEPATEIWLFDPAGLVEDTAGNLYFADRGAGEVFGLPVGHFIWRIAPDDTAEVVAGTGIQGTPRDGQQALQAELGAPAGLAVDKSGRLHFADPANHVVMRIEADGRLTRIAGTGQPGYGGDGGAAPAALLNQPRDVDVDAGDNLYIADYGNHRVRKVTPGGVITTVAGTGTPGFAGDHGPAAAAQLHGVSGVQVHPDGRLLIADSGNHVVRQVAADGTIATLAGTGKPGNDGDGGPADRAQLSAPAFLFVGPAGHLYVGDPSNHNIRVIEPDGTITTLIGDGAPGYATIGHFPGAAPLSDPNYVVVRANGATVISDGGTGRLLTFQPNGKVALLAGPAEHSITEAMARFEDHDPHARQAYEKRLRAGGLKE
jgi:sugar lactone lactonase YvrE